MVVIKDALKLSQSSFVLTIPIGNLPSFLDKGTLIYMDLEKDQDLFRGQGDYQFDIYRMMRKQINKDWAASCSRTNLFVSWSLQVSISLPSHLTFYHLLGHSERSFSNSFSTSFLYFLKWLHYIADKLLTEKDLKKPTKRLQTSNAKDDIMENWCYDRVLAVSRMSLDRLDPSGKTPSATVLDVLLHNRPS